MPVAILLPSTPVLAAAISYVLDDLEKQGVKSLSNNNDKQN